MVRGKKRARRFSVRRGTRALVWCSLVFGMLTVLAAGASPLGAAFPGPNGMIAFQSFRDGNAEIYLMTDAPTQPQRLTTRLLSQRRGCNALPSWSPDGKRIAFEFNPDPWGKPPTNSDIYLINANGTGLRRLTKLRGFDGDPTWSADGTRIAFEHSSTGLDRDTDVWVINTNGSGLKRLTSSPGFDGDPAWSPGGKRIAFTSARTGNREIFLMNPDGSAPLDITNNPASDSDPSWSPDGQFVAFMSDRDGNFEIYVTNDRFQLRRLTNNLALDALPSWSPDGKKIVFVSDRFEAGNRDLYVMNVDGTNVRRLTESPAWDVAPDWQRNIPGAAQSGPTPPPLKPLASPPNGKPGTQALACQGR